MKLSSWNDSLITYWQIQEIDWISYDLTLYKKEILNNPLLNTGIEFRRGNTSPCVLFVTTTVVYAEINWREG